MTIFVYSAVIIITILDGFPLIKNKQWDVFCVLASTLLVSLILISCYAFGLTPPLKLIVEYMTNILKPIFNF